MLLSFSDIGVIRKFTSLMYKYANRFYPSQFYTKLTTKILLFEQQLDANQLINAPKITKVLQPKIENTPQFVLNPFNNENRNINTLTNKVSQIVIDVAKENNNVENMEIDSINHEHKLPIINIRTDMVPVNVINNYKSMTENTKKINTFDLMMNASYKKFKL